MELILLSDCKSRNFEKTKGVKNNDKSKKHILQGEKNVRYYGKSREIQQKQFYQNVFIVKLKKNNQWIL